MKNLLTNFIVSACMTFAGMCTYSTSAVAQEPQQIDLSTLPALVKLQSEVTGWSELDTDLALKLLRQYLNQQRKMGPDDCKFKVSRKLTQEYEGLQNFAKMEEDSRRKGLPNVAFQQYGVLTEFSGDAPGFIPAHPNDPAWGRFQAEVLPTLEQFLNRIYQQENPAGLRHLVLKGYQSICNDLKKYMSLRFHAEPQAVQCLSDAAFDASELAHESNTVTAPGASIQGYRLSHPIAGGFSYRTLEIQGCTFKVKTQREETTLVESDDQSNGNVSHAAGVTAEHRAKPQMTIKAREEQKKIDLNVKAAAHEKLLEDRANSLKLYRDAQPHFVTESEKEENLKIHSSVRATTREGKILIRSFEKIHQESWTDQDQFSRDEENLNAILEKIQKGEEDSLKEKSEHYKKYFYDLLGVKLNPEHPFKNVIIAFNIALTSDEMKGAIRMLQKQNNPWIVGCRVRSLITKDASGAESAQKTLVDCLTPQFDIEYKDKRIKGETVGLPIPALVETERKFRDSCGIAIGSQKGMGLGTRKIDLFHLPRKNTFDRSSNFGRANKNIPKIIEVDAAVSGHVFDLFTRKPVFNAKVAQSGAPTSTHSDSSGKYMIPKLVPQASYKISAEHPLYQPNSVAVTKLVVGGVGEVDDIFLDPKRISIQGTIQETFKPKYGTGLKGLVVQMEGYPQFTGITDERGRYTIKDVPASLTRMTLVDPSAGHQSAHLEVALNPEQALATYDVKVVPNLTILHGAVHIPSGKPADGLKVLIEGHPEYETTTAKDGTYELKDVPPQTSNLKVIGDAENVYAGTAQSVGKLALYVSNLQDIIVKYNRSDISGRVYDVISKTSIAGATVWVEGARERYSAITDRNGNYEVRKVPSTARNLNVEVSKGVYVARPIAIDPLPEPGKDIAKQDFRLIPREYTLNKIVFVVTWNEKQYDIDSQLFFPDGRHLYFKTLRGNSSNSDGYLDRDDTDKSGRETTIISLANGHTKVAGAYRFLAFQYQNNNLSFSEAGVNVEIYRDGQLWKDVKPAQGRGRLWYVANITDQEIAVVNQYPAGDLYVQMDDLQSRLKNTENEIEKQTQMQTSLKLQAKTLADNLEKDKAALADLSSPEAGSAKETARQDAQKKGADLKTLKERIKKAPDLIAEITKDSAVRKVQIEELKKKFELDKVSTQTEIQKLDQQLIQLLGTYQ